MGRNGCNHPMTPSSDDRDNQQPQDSSHQTQSPPPDTSQPIPSGSLIAPISKDEGIRNRMLQNPHRITWTSKPVQEEMDIPRHPFYYEPPPPPSTFSAWGLPILLFCLTMFTTLLAGGLPGQYETSDRRLGLSHKIS